MHILDIAENSIRAGAKHIVIRLEIDSVNDFLKIVIEDDGEGMTEEQLKRATDPFFTNRPDGKVGLGLPMLDEASKAAAGRLSIDSSVGAGTTVTAMFQLSHIDRKPVGSMSETMVTLIAGHPGVDFKYLYRFDSQTCTVNTEEIKHSLGGVAINSADVLNFIRNYIRENTTGFS